MARSSLIAASALLLFSGAFVAASGCHLVAGIEEKTPIVGVGGGASTGGGMAGSGGGVGGMGGDVGGTWVGGGPGLLCGPGPQLQSACMNQNCDAPNWTLCHCGRCNRDCGAPDLACVIDDNEPTCKPRIAVSVNGFVFRAVTNGDAILFPNYIEAPETMTESQILKIGLDDTAATIPTTVFKTVGRINVMAADCERVYFAIEPESMVPGKLRFYDFGSGADADVVTADEYTVQDMVVDADRLYWTTAEGVSGDKVKAWHKNTQQVEVIAETPNLPTALALADGYLYWAERGDALIKRAKIPVQGGVWQSTTIVDGAGDVGSLIVDDVYVYWVDGPVGAQHYIKRAPRDKLTNGGTVFVTAAADTPIVGSLVVDQDYLYYTSGVAGAGQVYRAARGSGAVSTLVGKSLVDIDFDAQWLSMDNTRVYIASPSAGGLNHVLWVSK